MKDCKPEYPELPAEDRAQLEPCRKALKETLGETDEPKKAKKKKSKKN